MNYMEKLGKTDDYFKEWQEIISVAGSISAGMAIWFPVHHHKFNFNIPKYRLWAAIFLLSIEEPTHKKMERYLNR